MSKTKQVKSPIQNCQKLTKSLNTLLHVATEDELSEIESFLQLQVTVLFERKKEELERKHANEKKQLEELF